MVTVDGQVGVEFKNGDQVVCTQSNQKTKLIRSGEKSFFNVLREKLNWAKR
jgi:NAD kinase